MLWALRMAVAAGVAAFFVAATAAGARASPVTTVVLVHGAFADGSSWSKVIPILEAHGLKVIAVQIPLSSLGDDVAATKRAIDQADGPVVLVGHSWAGVPVTEAGEDPKVRSLVYVAAFVPDAGQSLADLAATAPPPAWGPEAIVKDGYMSLPLKAIYADFAPDLPRGEARILAATQVPWAVKCQTEKPAHAAWTSRPTWFVLTERDLMIDPALQARMAAHIGAKVVRVNANHVVMISQPRPVADAIVAAADAVR